MARKTIKEELEELMIRTWDKRNVDFWAKKETEHHRMVIRRMKGI